MCAEGDYITEYGGEVMQLREATEKRDVRSCS